MLELTITSPTTVVVYEDCAEQGYATYYVLICCGGMPQAAQARHCGPRRHEFTHYVLERETSGE